MKAYSFLTAIALSALLGLLGYRHYLLILELSETQKELITYKARVFVLEDSARTLVLRVDYLATGLEAAYRLLEEERERYNGIIRDTVAALRREIRELEQGHHRQVELLRDSFHRMIRDTLDAEKERWNTPKERAPVYAADAPGAFFRGGWWQDEEAKDGSAAGHSPLTASERFVRMCYLIVSMAIILTILAAAVQGLIRRRRSWRL